MNFKRVNILFISLFLAGSFLFLACKTRFESSQLSGNAMVLDSTMAYDSACLAIIAPYKEAIEIEMNEIISFSEIAITKNQPEGLLNNFISDLILYMCNTYYSSADGTYDVVVLNNGGLRSALPKGLITVGDVYRLMPFENEVVILTISSDKFLELVQFIINVGGVPFAGMQITSKQLQLDTLIVGGVPYDKNRNYTVITSDYLAYGGDDMSFFQNPIKSVTIHAKVRDLIINYLREQNSKGIILHPELDGRIVYE